jgi:hypothetical protein
MPRRPPDASLVAVQIRKTAAEAELAELKRDQLKGKLIDRSELLKTLEIIFSSIRQIVEASDLSRRDKEDILTNIATYPVAVKHAAEKEGIEDETETEDPERVSSGRRG